MTPNRTLKASILNVVASLLIASTGATILWIKTDGAQAFTSEAARRLAVLHAPRVLPSIELEASDGAHFTLDSLKKRLLVVDFVYTNCPTVCVSLGTTFARLQMKLGDQARDDIRLVSIGFDTENDTPRSLAAYGKQHRADRRLWTLARVANPRDLPTLLSSFGVVALADRYGGFTHNAALHIVDSGKGLVRILDADDVEGAFAFVSASRIP